MERPPPTPPEDIRTKKFGFGFLFLACYFRLLSQALWFAILPENFSFSCENLAQYRIGKRRHKRNRAKRYAQNSENRIFIYTLLVYFFPILRVAVLSYPVGGQVFPNFLGCFFDCQASKQGSRHTIVAETITALRWPGDSQRESGRFATIKNLLMPLFLMGCFSSQFSRGKAAP